MNSKRGNVAALWLAIALFMAGTGIANANANSGPTGFEPDRQAITQHSESTSQSQSKSELFTIGTLAAFAFVTAATALLTVRNQQDQ